jgi:hypothetical protein
MNIHMSATLAFIGITNLILLLAGTATIFGADRDYWADPRTKFRIVILRVLSVNLDVAALSSLITGHWMLAAAFGIEGLIVGAIGASLHPFMTWRDLRSGFRSVSARTEALSLPLEAKYALVDRACTQLAMLVFANAVAILALRAGWKWYAAVGIAYILSGLIGGILKFALGSSRIRVPRRLPE